MTAPIPLPELTVPLATPPQPAAPAQAPASAEVFGQLLDNCLGAAPSLPAEDQEQAQGEPAAPVLAGLSFFMAAPPHMLAAVPASTQPPPEGELQAAGQTPAAPAPIEPEGDPAAAELLELGIETFLGQAAPPHVEAPVPIPEASAASVPAPVTSSPSAGPVPPEVTPAASPVAAVTELTGLLETTGASVRVNLENPAVPQPSRPALADLAFAARLGERGAAQARKELLAVLASPELRAQNTGAVAEAPADSEAPPPEDTPAPLSEAAQPAPDQETPSGQLTEGDDTPSRPAPEAQETPSRPAADRTERESPAPRRLGAAQRQGSPPETRPEVHLLPRAVPRPDHPVFTDSRNPPMAPYRAPEFVATQPGTRTPWNNPIEPPADRIEVPRGPVHDLSVLVPAARDDGDRQAPVQVRVVERSGEVRVAVHTPDAELAQSMRQGIQDLVQRLEQSGYRTETWSPADRPLEGIRRQEPPAQNDTAGERHPDSQSSGRQHPRQQRQHPQDQPHWVETLAASGLGPTTASNYPDRSFSDAFRN